MLSVESYRAISGSLFMTWKEFTYNLVLEYCHTLGARTFTLRDFYAKHAEDFARFAPANRHPFAKVRQQLQFLRKDGLLTFVNNHGTYTLRGIDLLRDEVEEPRIAQALPDDAREREYLIEVHARDRGWVRMARLTYGDYCLIPRCDNTFLKPNGQRYIEVHHIDPLYEGGEEAIWNLSVVCAHHHRMAHFAVAEERKRLRDILIERTQSFLTRSS
jgi:hypothetical protein